MEAMSTKSDFSISIITPSFNYARFILDAVKSVNYLENAEHIIQDSCSKDETVSILEGASAPSLRVYVEKDEGQSDALNRAFEKSSGEVIGWLNADDYYLSTSIKSVMEAFAANPDIDVVFGDVIFVNEQGYFIRYLAGHRFLPKLLRLRGPVLQNTSTFYRKNFLAGLQWDKKLKVLMDWDFSLAVHSRRPKYKYLNKPLGVFRVHPSQITSTNLTRDSKEYRLVVDKFHLFSSHRGRRLMGNLVHRILKLSSGAFARELYWNHRLKNLKIESYNCYF